MDNLELKFNQVADLILSCGRDVTVMVQGEPGIGKSTVGQYIATKLGLPFAYMDMANMSLGDLTLPVANRESRCAEYFPNEILKLHTGKPVVVMMDEWTKASKEVKNMSLPLALERRLGSVQLHPDSIVFATGNLTKDGVGDSIQAHQLNRFIAVRQRKPTSEEWINDFALENNIDPTVIAFADQYPAILQSYLDDPNGENKYIFNPKKAQGAYVSPRSLKFASDIVSKRAKMDIKTLQAGLTGALGAAGAADLTAFVNLNEKLPTIDDIVMNPTKTPLPAEPVNRLLLVFNLIMRVDAQTIGPVLTYVRRLNNEMVGLFLNKMLSTPSKSEWAAHDKGMVKAATELHHLFG